MLFQHARLYLAGRFGGKAPYAALLARIERQNAKKNRLAWAAYCGDADAVQKLLDTGAQIDANPKSAGTALTYAATKGHLEIVQLLLDKGANPNADDGAALRVTAQNGRTDIVRALLSNGADVNSESSCVQTWTGRKPRTPDGWTALACAARDGHSGIVRLLLAHGADATSLGSGSALNVAAQNGHAHIVRALLEHGAEPNAKGSRGWTALILASQNGHYDVAKILLDNGAQPNVKTESKYRNTALWTAAYYGHTEIVRLLLDEGADVNTRADALRSAKLRPNNNEVVQLLQSYAGQARTMADRDISPLVARVDRHLRQTSDPVLSALRLSVQADDFGKGLYCQYRANWVGQSPDATLVDKLLRDQSRPHRIGLGRLVYVGTPEGDGFIRWSIEVMDAAESSRDTGAQIQGVVSQHGDSLQKQQRQLAETLESLRKEIDHLYGAAFSRDVAEKISAAATALAAAGDLTGVQVLLRMLATEEALALLGPPQGGSAFSKLLDSVVEIPYWAILPEAHALATLLEQQLGLGMTDPDGALRPARLKLRVSWEHPFVAYELAKFQRRQDVPLLLEFLRSPGEADFYWTCLDKIDPTWRHWPEATAFLSQLIGAVSDQPSPEDIRAISVVGCRQPECLRMLLRLSVDPSHSSVDSSEALMALATLEFLNPDWRKSRVCREMLPTIVAGLADSRVMYQAKETLKVLNDPECIRTLLHVVPSVPVSDRNAANEVFAALLNPLLDKLKVWCSLPIVSLRFDANVTVAKGDPWIVWQYGTGWGGDIDPEAAESWLTSKLSVYGVGVRQHGHSSDPSGNRYLLMQLVSQ